jgi:NADPH:quinone reductase-like Zn-dependent oxidoreductase
MSTHAAVVTASVRGHLQVIQIPTLKPTDDEVLVKVEWTASTPLDLHQNDGGLLVNHPQVLGDGVAGTVIGVGPDARRLHVGDKVCLERWFIVEGKARLIEKQVFGYCIRVPPGYRTSCPFPPTHILLTCHVV